jgi:hypothetical protein
VIQRKDRFLVVDAGGGTVVSSQQGSADYSSIHLWVFIQDFTSYKIRALEPLELEEIDPEAKTCLYAGSTFVDQSFEERLEIYLKQKYPATQASDRHIERAVSIFASLRKPEFSGKEKGTGFWEISDNPDDFDEGGIEIPW